MKKFPGKPFKLTIVAAVVSVLTLLVFHGPFFEYVSENVEQGLNGHLIVASLAVIMLAANFLATYLILYLGRIIGRAIVAASFICDAIMLYFVKTYDVMVDDTMMGNVFNTNFSEATSYWSWSAVAYIALAGILPGALLFAVKIDYGSLKRFFANIGIGLGTVAAIAFANMSNWTWMDRNSTVAGSLLMPWSYTVNAVRYQNAQRENRREEIRLPDASIKNDEKDVVVIVIGESARRDHFSLYGYERDTNPLLSATTAVTAYKANSNATYTTGGVKAILDSQETDKLYEILPNYLYRSGVDVIWRTSNWGQPPLHIDKYQNMDDLAGIYGEQYGRYDELLTAGLKELISESDKNKVLVILHTSTSHGPQYTERYPAAFEKFSPVSTSVEMSKCPHEHLVNAYDNSIVYTDYLLSRVIGQLKELEGWKSCMLFVSDHGESLGENGLYMHGVPMAIAPREQYEIPFIVWTSDSAQRLKPHQLVTQFYVFHSVLHFLGIESPAYKEEMNLFE